MAFGVPIMVVRTVRDGLVLVLDSDGSVLAHDMTGCDPHPGRIQGCALCLPHEVLES